MSSPWVLIDVSYLAHRALHSTGHLTHGSDPTGILFGFFNQLKQICQDNRIRSNKVVMFFDSKKSYRKKAYPEYKAKRHKNKTEDELVQYSMLKDQVKLLRRRILPDIGFPCYIQSSLESDDLIAYQARLFYSERAVIVTADQDLFQCIHSTCHWFDPAKDIYLDRTTFEIRKGIDPSQWGEVKAIAGCSSDNVKGILGVGETTAIRHLNGTLPEHYKAYQAIHSKEGQKIIERNRPLVVLPHAKTRDFEIDLPDYNPDAFFDYCKQYGLSSFLDQRKSWLSFFKGGRMKIRKRGEKRV